VASERGLSGYALGAHAFGLVPGERSVSESALDVEGYFSDAVQIASHFGESAKKLEVIRKVAGLCLP
jgi:hypothetical protein